MKKTLLNVASNSSPSCMGKSNMGVYPRMILQKVLLHDFLNEKGAYIAVCLKLDQFVCRIMNYSTSKLNETQNE